MEQTVKTDKDELYAKLDHFGKFQLYQYILIFFPLIVVAIMNVNYIFVAGETNYR